MPEHAELCVDHVTLQRAQGGRIDGTIWFRVARLPAFPDEDWFDFPVAVVAGLVQALESVEATGRGSAIFFDGPFEVRLASSDSGAVLQLVERKFGPRGVPVPDRVTDVAIDWDIFAAHVRERAGELLAECSRRGLDSPDGDDIRAALSRPRRAKPSGDAV